MTERERIFSQLKFHVQSRLRHRIRGTKRTTLLDPPERLYWKVGEVLMLVGEEPGLALAGAALPVLEEIDKFNPRVIDSLAPVIDAYVTELIEARQVLHRVRGDQSAWKTLEALSSRAKTVILAHQIPKIFAIGHYREPLEKLEHQGRIWEHCAGGNQILWEAVAVLLRGARGKIESPLLPRPPRSPRQHRQCYKCKHMHHFSEFVSMTGEPSRKSSLCRRCYWNYEHKRLDDLRYWERQYRVLYQKWFGPDWRLYADANKLVYYVYKRHPNCAYCGRPNPPFSHFERRPLRRDRTKVCRADPLLDRAPCITPKTAETDFLDYLEHGGIRALPNFVIVCGDCKVRRRDTPLAAWVEKMDPGRKAWLTNLYRQRFPWRLGDEAEHDSESERKRQVLRQWEQSFENSEVSSPSSEELAFLHSGRAYHDDHPARLRHVMAKIEENRWKPPSF